MLVTLAVLLLRLPFLNQAIQGDDVYYLAGAEHAQIDPLHPNHARYPFLGQTVDMRGHPHPPLNAWYLALLLAIFKDICEPAFHAAYILFSLLAAWSALALAHRFSPHPLLATLLFLAAPAFVVNGNSLESDVPFLAFWLASLALFTAAVDRRSGAWLAASCVATAAAALSAYQALVLVPILLLYSRRWRPGLIAAFTVPAVLGLWQLYERSSTGELPATVLAGYMQSYGLQVLAQKAKNAAALTAHLGWIVFPALWLRSLAAVPAALCAALVDWNPLFWASIAAGVGLLAHCIRHWRDFLCRVVLIFFTSALLIFFAGSARYLLPLALPVAVIATHRFSRRALSAALIANAVLWLCLAAVNYQHWDGYRQFARSLAKDVETKRVWINGEWGLRYYFESEGALPLMRGQALHPGEMVVTSALAYPIPATGTLAPFAERVITSPIPLRLVALNGKSAYSTTLFGLRPFDISTGPIDRVTAEVALDRKPALAWLPMNDAAAQQQIVSGIDQLENGQWRWMMGRGVLLLKPPPVPAPLRVEFFLPPQAPGRRVQVFLNDALVAEAAYPQPGQYSLESKPLAPGGDTATLAITVDKTFSVPGDQRQLGLILSAAGFKR